MDGWMDGWMDGRTDGGEIDRVTLTNIENIAFQTKKNSFFSVTSV